MGKRIVYGLEAQNLLKEGVVELASAVKVTLGGKGTNVVIDMGEHFSPKITKDGVTVARNISFDEPIKNMGAKLIRDVAEKVNDIAGDGTTTATVLAESIFIQGIKMVTAGANPILIKRGMDKACKLAVELLKEEVQTIDEQPERVEQIANISANGDTEIGRIVADCITKVTSNGVIVIEEGKSQETLVQYTEGMQFEKGYLSPYFCTDLSRLEAVYEKPYIYLCSDKVNSFKQLLPALEIAVRDQRPLIIISDSIDTDVLSYLVVNRVKGGVQVVAVQSPSYGEMRLDMMEDIAVLTGGENISERKGTFGDGVIFEENQFGTCDRIIVTKDKTMIINGAGNETDILSRITQIKEIISSSKSEYDSERYKERLAKLDGGVAVIYVGGTSEVEVKEKKDRYEDALNATRAAIDEGIVPGGGIALLRIHSHLSGLVMDSEDEKYGLQIVCEAILSPLKQILLNAGEKVDVIINNLLKKGGDYGYNVYTNTYEHFFQSGVIDPFKVTRVALESAVSISGTLLTTSCVVSEIKKDEQSN